MSEILRVHVGQPQSMTELPEARAVGLIDERSGAGVSRSPGLMSLGLVLGRPIDTHETKTSQDSREWTVYGVIHAIQAHGVRLLVWLESTLSIGVGLISHFTRCHRG